MKSHRGGTYSAFSWNDGSPEATADTFSVHPSLWRLHWLRQLITWTLFPCKYLCVLRILNAPFHYLSGFRALSICCSLTLNKIIHSLSQVFSILAAILPLLANHTHTYVHCQLVFTHSCMQLPATRRYLKHETLWFVLFIRSIKIALPWMSINLPSVCVSVYSSASGIPLTMHQRVESCLSLAK